MNLDTIMNGDALKDVIRKAGGVVHSDGNIFFTHAMQFLRAASAATPSEWAMVPPEPDEALLRPFYECPPAELPIAYKAMLWIALTRRRRIEVLPGHAAPDPHTEGGVRCECGDIYPADSWGAGFIDAKGHCANCDTANSEPLDTEGLLPYTAAPPAESRSAAMLQDAHSGLSRWLSSRLDARARAREAAAAMNIRNPAICEAMAAIVETELRAGAGDHGRNAQAMSPETTPLSNCSAGGMCHALAARCGDGKGFKAVHSTRTDSNDEQFVGVAYKTSSRDRGLMLNVCPFCGGAPGYFVRTGALAAAASAEILSLLRECREQLPLAAASWAEDESQHVSGFHVPRVLDLIKRVDGMLVKTSGKAAT